MFDSHLRPLIERSLSRSAKHLVTYRVTANLLTALGFIAGMLAAFAVAVGAFQLALFFGVASRLLDGLDGMVARLSGPTILGGYFDILADFTFYAVLPLAFVIFDPATNGVAGAALLASFFINASSFLGFAILAEKHGHETNANGKKSHYHSTGLIEGGETIAFFAICMIWPSLFAPLGLVFAGLVILTVLLRVKTAIKLF